MYGYQQPQPASTEYVRYAWSPSIYAVTKWPGGERSWMWVPLSFQQWQTAGFPTPSITGWIKGSTYYQWVTDSAIFVDGPDYWRHQLTYAEWAASGFQPFTRRNGQGFVKLSWSSDIALITDLSTGEGRPIGYAEWEQQAFPRPAEYQRITGDSFFQRYGESTIWYTGPMMTRPISFLEWQAAGFPAPVVLPPTSGGTVPPNPGNTRNCYDFITRQDAQNWFDRYYPYYGDVAQLDLDHDQIACESRI